MLSSEDLWLMVTSLSYLVEEVWKRSGIMHRLLSHFGVHYDTVLNRKLRLFTCGCCRRNWQLLTDGRLRRAVEAAEQYADRLLGPQEMQTAVQDAAVAMACTGYTPGVPAASASELLGRAADETVRVRHWTPIKVHVFGDIIAGAEALAAMEDCEREHGSGWRDVYLQLGCYVNQFNGHYEQFARDRAHQFQCDLLRDLFGNPFRPVSICPSWTTWNNRTTPRLASEIYETNNFSLLPILGDALSEAGCSDPNVIDHCRVPGVHARGCWLVDQLRECLLALPGQTRF